MQPRTNSYAYAHAHTHAHARIHAKTIFCPLLSAQAAARSVRTRLRGVLPGVLPALNLPAHVHHPLEPTRGGWSTHKIKYNFLIHLKFYATACVDLQRTAPFYLSFATHRPHQTCVTTQAVLQYPGSRYEGLPRYAFRLIAAIPPVFMSAVMNDLSTVRLEHRTRHASLQNIADVECGQTELRSSLTTHHARLTFL